MLFRTCCSESVTNLTLKTRSYQAVYQQRRWATFKRTGNKMWPWVKVCCLQVFLYVVSLHLLICFMALIQFLHPTNQENIPGLWCWLEGTSFVLNLPSTPHIDCCVFIVHICHLWRWVITWGLGPPHKLSQEEFVGLRERMMPDHIICFNKSHTYLWY